MQIDKAFENILKSNPITQKAIDDLNVATQSDSNWINDLREPNRDPNYKATEDQLNVVIEKELRKINHLFFQKPRGFTEQIHVSVQEIKNSLKKLYEIPWK